MYQLTRVSRLRPPTLHDLSYFRSILPHPDQVLTSFPSDSHNVSDLLPYNRDWTGRHTGRSPLVLRPHSASEVSSILAYCHSERIGLVPRGGNTSLCGGATPISDEIVLSSERMNRIRSLDSSGILVCDAGCILQNLQEYAEDRGYLLPLDIGSKGTCAIGGNVATNAGGQYFFRFGGLHANVIGIEVVLPVDGKVMRFNMGECGDGDGPSMSSGCHRKDNTGYDLKHLFIGSEGTLGFVTKVAMTCPPLPSSRHVAILICDSYSQVLNVLQVARSELGEILSAMELIDFQTLRLVKESLTRDDGGEAFLLNTMLNDIDETCQTSASESTSLVLLVETQGSNWQHDASKLDSFLTHLYESNTIRNGFLSQDSKQITQMWNVRESCNPSLARTGYVYKYDVSIPIEEYMDVATEVKNSLQCSQSKSYPPTKVCVWGHVADGNAHINIVTPGVFIRDDSLADHVDDTVYGSVMKRGGSISAEHGLGQTKNEYLRKIKDGGVLDAMVKLKALFDPHGIMNPGKYLPIERDSISSVHDS